MRSRKVIRFDDLSHKNSSIRISNFTSSNRHFAMRLKWFHMLCPVRFTAEQLSTLLELPVQGVVSKDGFWEVQLSTLMQKSEVLSHDFQEIMGARIRVLLPNEPLTTVEQFRSEAEAQNASTSLVLSVPTGSYQNVMMMVKRAFEKGTCGKVRIQQIGWGASTFRDSNSDLRLVRLVFADAFCRAVAERSVLRQVVSSKKKGGPMLTDDPGYAVQVKKWSRRVRV